MSEEKEFPFRPTGNRVVVDLQSASDMSGGGLYLPETARSGHRSGVVMAVSEGYAVSSGWIKSVFQVGDKVLVDDLGAQKIRLGDKEYHLVRNEDVIGIYTA